MTNRELETRYMHMKQTWKTLVDANVNLVDENKDLKEEIERLNNIINKAKEKSIFLQKRYGYVLDDLTYLLMQGSDKE